MWHMPEKLWLPLAAAYATFSSGKRRECKTQIYMHIYMYICAYKYHLDIFFDHIDDVPIQQARN